MSTTCEKCGHENTALRNAAVCPKCATPYGARTARGPAQPVAPAMQAAAAGGVPMPAAPAGAVSPLRAAVGGGVLLVLIALGISTLATSSRRADERAAQVQREWAQRVATAITQREVLIGMTAEQVRKAWGEPTSINETITRDIVMQQWVYRTEDYSTMQFVYLENGRVRSKQNLN